MARTKRTTKKISLPNPSPRKREKSAGGVKFASPSSPVSPPASPSSARPIVGLLSPKPSPEKTMHEALTRLLDQGIMWRMTNLGLGTPQGRNAGARAAGSPPPSQQLPLDMALLEQDPRRALAERDVADRDAFTAHREMERLRRAYFQDSPL
ncbi:hypothetical protein LIER_13920 [Lithospermum erythrorhizon]|uniref:Uncharacterized protein n=1 Tax=Lithospermum erythrorhizon TaxID=34254 RepID=A0AAV3Q0C9_LITER